MIVLVQVMQFATPFGWPLSVAVVDGSVVSSGFVRIGNLPIPPGAGDVVRVVDTGVAACVRDWLGGEPDALSRVPVSQPGSPFRQAVWDQMRSIPGGSTSTYGQIAAMAGHARAARAVGAACASNRVAPFVPCHRVVPSAGGIGRYAYGSALKSALLEFEAG
ncbi:MAG: methylated-DNA--[protein]-cysteine S-methyltransferase [Candidatus Nanopelagicales bacterium]|nr:methylated-DNA--[protein]-cysteine S-methyltransferase [Candidatus Nanopelagicales bacterium]MDZ4249788.1 methylated-DNA--[protein]-cysteine S-methyltransferase [Candidatus Nanopelagicales bacterium]MDZ7577208.1 methylated-DNA--[protein]-cysteine S-methyltransferase [Candidatus Nanopelagicales bacterium]